MFVDLKLQFAGDLNRWKGTLRRTNNISEANHQISLDKLDPTRQIPFVELSVELLHLYKVAKLKEFKYFHNTHRATQSPYEKVGPG